MHQGDRPDAPLAFPEGIEQAPRFQAAGLKTEQAAYNLQVVLDAMMDLLEQRGLFAQGGNLLFGLAALGQVAAEPDNDTLAVPSAQAQPRFDRNDAPILSDQRRRQ